MWRESSESLRARQLYCHIDELVWAAQHVVYDPLVYLGPTDLGTSAMAGSLTVFDKCIVFKSDLGGIDFSIPMGKVVAVDVGPHCEPEDETALLVAVTPPKKGSKKGKNSEGNASVTRPARRSYLSVDDPLGMFATFDPQEDNVVFVSTKKHRFCFRRTEEMWSIVRSITFLRNSLRQAKKKLKNLRGSAASPGSPTVKSRAPRGSVHLASTLTELLSPGGRGAASPSTPLSTGENNNSSETRTGGAIIGAALYPTATKRIASLNLPGYVVALASVCREEVPPTRVGSFHVDPVVARSPETSTKDGSGNGSPTTTTTTRSSVETVHWTVEEPSLETNAIFTTTQLVLGSGVAFDLRDLPIIHLVPGGVRVTIAEGGCGTDGKSSNVAPFYLYCCRSIQRIIARLWLANIDVTLKYELDKNLRPPPNIDYALEAESRGIRDLEFLMRVLRQFCAIDQSLDGNIQEDELQDALGPLFNSPAFVSCFFCAFDINHDGDISFREFASGIRELLSRSHFGKTHFTFRIFDRDGDGRINRDEFEQIVKSLCSTGELDVPERHLSQFTAGLFEAIDTDGSGAISMAEYEEAIKGNPHVYQRLKSVGLSLRDNAKGSREALLSDDMVCFGDYDWRLATMILLALRLSMAPQYASVTIQRLEAVDYTYLQESPVTICKDLLQDIGVPDFGTHTRQAHNNNNNNNNNSNNSASSTSTDIPVTMVSYAPRVFAAVRHRFDIKDRQFKMAMGLDNVAANMLLGARTALRRVSVGKHFSYLSHDQNFIVKACSASEIETLMRILPHYVAHMAANPHTLLQRIYGAYRVRSGGLHTHFVLLHNLLATPKPLGRVYYVKGEPGRCADADYDPLMYFEGDMGTCVTLAEDWASGVHEQLTADIRFLVSQGLNNYSCLIGLEQSPHLDLPADKRKRRGGSRARRPHPNGVGMDESRQEDGSSGSSFSCCGNSNVKRQQKQRGYDYVGDGSLLPSRLSKTVANANGASSDDRFSVGMSATFGESTWLAGFPVTSKFCVQRGGIPHGSDRGASVFIGIVDILQFHNGKVHELSVPRYGVRFSDFLKLAIVSRDDDLDSSLPMALSESLHAVFSVRRQSGGRGTLVVHKTEKEILLLRPNHNRPIDTFSIRYASETGFNIVKRLEVSDRNKKEVILRDGLHEKDGKVSFSKIYKLQFATMREREHFVSVVQQLSDPTVGVGVSRSDINVFIGTWNVGEAAPPDLWPFLKNAQQTSPRKCELVVIAAQECNYEPRDAFKSCEEDWFSRVRAALPGYVLLAQQSLWTMRMCLFVASGVVHRVSNVGSATEATGIGHVLGNKGGLAIALKFDESSFCFVGSHLAAHLECIDRRNEDFSEIIEGVSARLGSEDLSLTSEYQHVFWCGDLNYRIDHDREQVMRHVALSRWDELHQFDQLHAQKKQRKCFVGFDEEPPQFPPTYRYLRNTELTAPRKYDDGKQRIPSWCDRILHAPLGHPLDTATRVSYNCVDEIRSSDHSPVYAVFRVPVRHQYVFNSRDYTCKELHITHLRAANLVRADLFGLSDPFVTFRCPFFVHSRKTPVILHSLNPDWGQEVFSMELFGIQLSQLLTGYLVFVLKDYDVGGNTDPLGEAVIPLDLFDLEKLENPPINDERLAYIEDKNILLNGQPAGTLSCTLRLVVNRE